MLRYLFLGLLSVLLTSSCAIESPEFMGSESMEGFKIDGKTITFNAGIKMSNPNWFAIKIKRSMLDVYIEEQYMGKLSLDKKVKLKAKRESVLQFPLKAELEDGAMFTILRYASKENVNIRFKGKVKGGVWLFSKKIEIDETRQVSGKSLQLNQLGK